MSSDGGDTPERSTKQNPTTLDQDEGTGYDTLIDHYKKLIEYKNNMFKTDALLAIEKDSMIQEELNKVRANLLQAISYEEDVIKFTQNSDDYYFSPDLLDNKCIDRLCRCYFKPENRWYNSKIESVDIENQEGEVTFIGYTERVKAHACFIKLIPSPDPINFQVGTQCEAIYGGDGKYYPCTIEKITEAGYHVKFRKYNNKEIVSLYHLREVETNNAIPDVSEMKEFKIPDSLKILPNDSEAQRKKKKKKQKALKAAFKVQQIEKASSEKQSQWQSFNDKATTKKKGHFQMHKESIFKSPDSVDGKVGVTGSGKAMTQYGQRARYVFQDGAPNGQGNSNTPNLF